VPKILNQESHAATDMADLKSSFVDPILASKSHSIPARIAALPCDGPVSALAENAAMILVVCLFIITFFRRALEMWFLPYFHGQKYSKFSERQRTSFVNSYVHLISRIAILPAAAPPLILILSGRGGYDKKYPGIETTYGDIEIVSMELAISIYIHEIIYRPNISLVSLAHHTGAIVIGSYSILHTLEWKTTPNATMYFTMALLWGLFDIICESWVHLALIYRTLRPNPNWKFKVCCFAAVVQFLGISIETPFVTWIFYSKPMRERWQLSYLISTPIVHAIFLAAQVMCLVTFYQMASKYRQQAMKRNSHESLESSASKAICGVGNDVTTENVSRLGNLYEGTSDIPRWPEV
jgi:hypothetical protein